MGNRLRRSLTIVLALAAVVAFCEWRRRSQQSQVSVPVPASPPPVAVKPVPIPAPVPAPQNVSESPAEQFKALRAEYNRAARPPARMTDEERAKYVGGEYRRHYAMGPKFVELAEKYPNDPIAVDALMQAVWQVNTTWPVEVVGQDTVRGKVFELLARDHARSDKLSPLCQRISYGFYKEYDAFLRAVFEKNPNKEVQASACLALARYLKSRAQRVELCSQQPDLAKEFTALCGKEYLAELQAQDSKTVDSEIETLLERAAREFKDVTLSDGTVVAERCAGELFELRELRVGKIAPEIEADDQDGKRFKLSDYRGKVVLLDFWSYV